MPAPTPQTVRAPRASLEQWQALISIVEAGGYAQAAQQLNKTQSAITYLIGRLEELLGIRLFERQGRRAVLTAAGQMAYQRAQVLVSEALRLERASQTLAAGWSPKLHVAAEVVFPSPLLLKAMENFAETGADTRIEVFETVLTGTQEALLEGKVDLAISPFIPTGFLGEPLLRLKLVALASPSHPLHGYRGALGFDELRQHRQLLVRDSGVQRGLLKAGPELQQQWIFSSMALSLEAAIAGLGFAWYPESRVEKEVAAGLLKPLRIRDGASQRHIEIYLVLADPQASNPAVHHFANCLRESCKQSEEPKAEA
ncbi:MAG: LysR family transcriptional regulator [Burkholderiaceae bacterium]